MAKKSYHMGLADAYRAKALEHSALMSGHAPGSPAHDAASNGLLHSQNMQADHEAMDAAYTASDEFHDYLYAHAQARLAADYPDESTRPRGPRRTPANEQTAAPSGWSAPEGWRDRGIVL